MERKIGEIFEYNGEWYQCVKYSKDNYPCIGCYGCKGVGGARINGGECNGNARKDNKFVIFKKLEKVGEPILFGNKIMQRYKVFVTPYISKELGYFNIKSRRDLTILIEIKQNKEDMEEKGQCCDNCFDIIAKAKEALLKETNIARDKQEMAVIDNILFRCWQMGWLDKYDDIKHTNSENSVKNLKPFNLEAAKAGKPVCTRDGGKVRILCFDFMNEKFPIIAAMKKNGEDIENIITYTKEGRYYSNNETSDYDLMMLPEKKEGWANVYDDTPIYDTKEEALNRRSEIRGYIDTVKVSWEE